MTIADASYCMVVSISAYGIDPHTHTHTHIGVYAGILPARTLADLFADNARTKIDVVRYAAACM